MTPKEYKQMMEYLTRSGIKDQVKFASDLARPNPKPIVKEIELFNAFNKRNPRADGGMLVQPSADGRRPGYAKDKKKISNTEGLEKLIKQDKITNKNVQNWTTKWIKQNSKNYNVRQFNLFKKDMAKAWSEEIKNKKKYNPFRLNITTSEGLPNARGLNINNITTPAKKDPTLGFEKIFYDQMFKNKDFKKKVIEYLDFVNIDKRFGSVRDDLVAQGKIATDDDGKAFFKKSSGSKKAYLDYAKFIDEDVVYFFGDVLNSRRLYNNNPASLNIYSIIEKNTPPEKIQKYRKKLATSYSSWMNNLKEVADLAGMDFNKVLEMQYNESAKMKKLFNVSELPFDFQYAQDHLFGLAEAKELGDPKIAKQTLKNLVATTKAQNAYLGTKGFTQKRTKLIRNFKNAPLENKANIVNQLNTLAEEYVPGRLQYNVKKDGSLRITNLQPEGTFKARTEAYKNLAKDFPKPLYQKLMKFCPKSNGGAAGTCTLEEAMDGLVSESKQLQSGNMNEAQAKRTAQKIRAVTRVGTGATLTSLLGPYGLAGEVVIDGGFIANNMLEGGDTYKEALSKSLIKYAMPTDQRRQLEKETDRDRMILGSDTQGLAADYVSAQQKYEDLINKYENLQRVKKDQTFDPDTLVPTYSPKDEIKAEKEFERAQVRAEPMFGKNIFDIIKFGSPEQQAFAAKEEVFDAQKMQNRIDYDKKILGPLKDLFGTGFYSPAQLDLLQRQADRESLEIGQIPDELKTQQIGTFGGVANLAGGGIAKLAGVPSGPPPESGPNSQGLPGLLKRVKKL